MVKLVVAAGAADAVDAMAGAGLLLPILGGVPHVAHFRAIATGEGGDRVHPAIRLPAFRLAALGVCIAEDAVRLQERLRLSNDEADRVSQLAAAMEAVSGRVALPSIAPLRHLAQRVGADAVAGALVLLGTHADADRRSATQALIADLGATPAFLLGGRDVLALGVPAGPAVGRVLERTRSDWIAAGCPAERPAQEALLGAAIAAPPGGSARLAPVR